PQTSPFQRPAISPYLNLFRPGGNFTQNYFGLVQPQMQFYSGINQLQMGQFNLSRQITGLEAQQFPTENAIPTGMKTGFFTHQKYFMTQFQAAGATGGTRGTTGTTGSQQSQQSQQQQHTGGGRGGLGATAGRGSSGGHTGSRR